MPGITTLQYSTKSLLMKPQILTKSLFILLICGSLISCSKKDSDPTVVRSMKYRSCLKDAYSKIGLFYHANIVPGMTVAVSIDNNIVWADGFGYSNYELKTKTSPANKFRIGQLTELITSLTAAKLYEEGKFQIDRRVSELFPDISPNKLNYTIRQLGGHSAGIRNEDVPAGKGEGTTLEKFIPLFINDNLMYPPGMNFSHTELGFDLMGYLIEKTTKNTFSKVVAATLDTLHLGIMPDSPYRIIDGKANTYDYDFVAQPMVAGPIDLRGKEASAGYLASVFDLVKLGNTLLYPGFLKEETLKLFSTPYKISDEVNSSYSFGMIVSKDFNNRLFYAQRGSVTGGSAALLIYPEDKMVIAMTSNVESGTWELPVFEVAESFLKKLHPELFKEEKKDEAPTEQPQSNEAK